MKRKLTLVGATLAVTTAVFGGTAHAGATISDKRFWPNEAHSSGASSIARVEQSGPNPAMLRGVKKQHERDKRLKTRRNQS